MSDVIVEFYGIPRERAGRTELNVQAATVADALAAVEQACPGLKGLFPDGVLTAHYRLSLDGQQFIENVQQVLSPGSRLLLISADAGG